MNIFTFAFALYAFACTTSQSLMSLAGTLIAALSLWEMIRHRKVIWREPAARVLVIFAFLSMAYALTNLLVRTPWQEGDARSLRNVPLLLIPLLALQARTLRVSIKDSVVWVAFAVGAAVSFTYNAFAYLDGARIGVGFFGNPIYFAYNVLPAFVFACEGTLRDSRQPHRAERWRLLLPFTAALLFLELLSAGTRGPLLCAGLYLAARPLPSLARSQGWAKTAFIMAILMVTVFLSYREQPYLQGKIQALFSGQDPSLQARFAIWRENFEMFSHSPIFGTGTGRNGVFAQGTPGLIDGAKVYAHNVYLQALTEGGIVGLLLFLGFWVAAFLAWPGARPLLLVLALAGVTENLFNNSKVFHAVYCFVLLQAVLIRPRENPQ